MSLPIAIAGAFALLAGALPAAVSLLPQPGLPVAVIAWPWAERGAALRIVIEADGMLIDAHRDGRVAIANSASSDFIARLYRSGAAVVLDGTGLSGCLSDPRHTFIKG